MSQSQQRKGRSIGLLGQGLVALVVTVGAFWLAFRDIEADKLWDTIGRSNLAIVVLFIVGMLANHLLRTWRWALLVQPLGNASPRAIFAASSVGFPATFFVPLRLGEFVRPVMLVRSGVPFAGAMASVVVERVADGVFNLGIFFLLLRLMPASTPLDDRVRGGANLALIVFGGMLIVLVLMVIRRNQAFALVRAILKPVSPAIADRLLGLLGAFIDGLSALRSPGRVLLFIVLTVAFWTLNGLLTWFLAVSYLPELQGQPSSGLFVNSVVVFAIMIPSGPAFAGVFEVGFKYGLAPYLAAGAGTAENLDLAPALGVAVAMHVVQGVVMLILGLIGYAAAEPGQLSFSWTAGAPPKPPEKAPRTPVDEGSAEGAPPNTAEPAAPGAGGPDEAHSS